MGPPTPDAGKRLVDRFDQDRKVFLSGDYKEEQLPKAKTPHVWADSTRLTASGPDRLTREGMDGMIGLKEKRI